MDDDITEGVSVINEVILGHDAIVFVWTEVNRESTCTGRSKEEAVRPFFIRDELEVVAICITITTKDMRMIVVEESEVC